MVSTSNLLFPMAPLSIEEFPFEDMMCLGGKRLSCSNASVFNRKTDPPTETQSMKRSNGFHSFTHRSLNMPPEERMAAVLHVCEDAARSLGTDYDDEGHDDAQFMKVCFDRLISRLKSVKENAKADPLRCGAFYNVLEKSHSMRVEHVEPEYKNGVRQKSVCMACGRMEKNCTNKISLSGPFLGQWDKECKLVSKSWKDFEKGYNTVYEDDFVEDAVSKDALPEEDYGDYMVGNTCLRKAQLTFLLNTFIMEIVYDMAFRSRDAEGLEDGVSYFCNDDEAEETLEKLDWLERCVADSGKPLPLVVVDEGYWNVIDEARNAVSEGDENRLIRLIRERAYTMLGKDFVDEESDEDGAQSVHSEGFVVSSDESDGEQYVRRGPRNEGPSRKRPRRVVSEDEEEEVSEGEELQSCEPVKVMRRSLRVQKKAAEVSGSEPAPKNAKEKKRPEKRCVRKNAEDFVRSQRKSPGCAMASREDIITELVKLKLRLISQGKQEDSAVCTAAIFQMEADMARLS